MKSLFNDHLVFDGDANSKSLVEWAYIFNRNNIVGPVERTQVVEVELDFFMPRHIFINHSALVFIEDIPKPKSSIAAEVHRAAHDATHRHSDVLQLVPRLQVRSWCATLIK